MTPEQELEALRKILAGLRRPQAPLAPPIPALPGISLETVQAIVIALCVIAALALLAILFYVARPAIARRLARKQVVVEPTSTTQALEQAVALADDGDLRSAMRQLYLATLLLLDERGILSFDRTLTNREIVGALRPLPELAQALQPVVNAYDPVWYGRKPIDNLQFEDFRQRIEGARAAAPPAPAASAGPETSAPILPSEGRNV